MKFLISGYYGFGNAGDEAVLASIIEGLQRRFTAPEVCVLSASPQLTTDQHRVRAVQRWAPMKVWRQLSDADVFIQGGGGLLQDTTSIHSPLYYLALLQMARWRRVLTMVFAQGIGPLRSFAVRRLAARQLANVDAITVRDRQSLDELAEMEITEPEPIVTADPALLLEPGHRQGKHLLVNAGLNPDLPTAVITLRPWEHTEQVTCGCRELAARLVTGHGFQVLCVPFGGRDDAGVMAPVAEVDSRVALAEPNGFAAIASLIAGARLVVSMRLHGLVFAAANAVPAVGVSYDPKVDAFAAIAAQPVLSVDDCAGGKLLNIVEDIISEDDQTARRRDDIARGLKKRAERNFEVLVRMTRQHISGKAASCNDPSGA